MSDLDKFIDLYKGFGVECTLKSIDSEMSPDVGFEIWLRCSGNDYKEGETVNKVAFSGSFNRFSCISFSKEGKFLRQAFG